MKKTKLNPILYAEDNFELQSPRASEKGVKLISEIKDVLITTDVAMMNSILRNLLSNAIKFTPVEGTIKVNGLCDENDLIIEIEDNGQGIPKDDIRKILNPNEHFSKLGTEKEPGTGLGLILCQNFIEPFGFDFEICEPNLTLERPTDYDHGGQI